MKLKSNQQQLLIRLYSCQFQSSYRRIFIKSGSRQFSSSSTTTSPTSPSSLSDDLQSLLKSRRTATKLIHYYSIHDNDDDDDDCCDDENDRDYEIQYIIDSISRAVLCGQMAPNHKRTEPFTFKQILAYTETSKTLAEISYQVAVTKTTKGSSIPVAERKRQKWLQIPAFLVTLIHDNQDYHHQQQQQQQEDPFKPLPFIPPQTERQLEDYASACSAIQNVLLSLHADGIGSKWATGPVILTPAFRNLVQAKSTDRIGGLIMIGGMNSSTSFSTDREEMITNIRRKRRRSLKGDVLVDLP